MTRQYRRPRHRLGFVELVWLVIFGAILGAAIVFSVPDAEGAPTDVYSDPLAYAAAHSDQVCAVLDAEPSFDGIADAALAIVNTSRLTTEQAGEVIGLSVRTACPQHAALLKRFVNTYSPQTVSVTT